VSLSPFTQQITGVCNGQLALRADISDMTAMLLDEVCRAAECLFFDTLQKQGHTVILHTLAAAVVFHELFTPDADQEGNLHRWVCLACMGYPACGCFGAASTHDASVDDNAHSKHGNEPHVVAVHELTM